MSPLTDSAFRLPSSPVAQLGTATLLVAFVVNAYSMAAGIAGHRHGRPRMVTSAIWASWAFAALMVFASCLMVYAFLSHDYTIKYVAHYSDTSMPLFYKITAYWGGLDGSLMFWVAVLACFSAVAVWVNRRRHRDIIGYVIATVAAACTFFLGILLYSKNPFSTFLTEPPLDGKGLNPLLQNYWMVIHPPSLYIGFVAMTIPYAFCMAALASGRLDDAWLHSVRVWVLIAWFFLSLGLTLGGIWAYEELGWGGYWAWDPVENAGLLPWFTATAFLHSVMIQERRGMLKVWNVVLMVTSFFLTIFGTFMTRSGVVQSVHAFGQDNQLAMLFILFMAVILTISFGLIVYRLPALRSGGEIESFASREFVFLLNNWILLAAAFFVLFATMFPTLSESIVGQRITIGPPFFNKWMIPIGLTLLFLTGAGPLLAWKRTSRKKLVEQFVFPGAAMLVTTVAIALLWPRWRVTSAFLSDKIQLPLSLVCFGLVAFTIAAMAQEFWRGVKARRKQSGSDPFSALVGLVLSKRRKYGGYIVHIGVALMFLGFAGKARSYEKQVTLDRPGERFEAGGLTFRYDDFQMAENDNHVRWAATVTVLKGDEVVTVLHPERRHYKKGQESTTEIAIDRRLDKDIYLVLNGFDPGQKLANFTLFLNPLVNWVWLGFGLLAFGTGICLIPDRLVGAAGRRRAGAGASAAILALALGGAAFGLAPVARAAGEAEAADEAQAADKAQAADEEAPRHVERAGGSGMHEDHHPVAVKAMNNIVCMCGDCKRQSVYQCSCPYAAKERQRIAEMVAKMELGTPQKDEAAYSAVMKAFMEEYGGQHVLMVPLDTQFNRLAWAVPYVAFAGGLGLLILVGRRWLRRGRGAAAAAAAKPKSPGAADENDLAYEDKLDDELDRLD